jgi:hypothetical protein
MLARAAVAAGGNCAAATYGAIGPPGATTV